MSHKHFCDFGNHSYECSGTAIRLFDREPTPCVCPDHAIPLDEGDHSACSLERLSCPKHRRAHMQTLGYNPDDPPDPSSLLSVASLFADEAGYPLAGWCVWCLAEFRSTDEFETHRGDPWIINSKFRDTEIDTTNFSKVRFTTEEPKVEGSPLITPEYTLIEGSIVRSKRSPPETGVLDLTMTGDDVVFDNVFFLHSRLEGWFRPEWFRNSTFEDCKLPSSLTREALIKAGNNVAP